MAEVGSCDICGKRFDLREGRDTEYCDIHDTWFRRTKMKIWIDAKRAMQQEILEKKREFGRD